jgi:CubicO group peptidase (beta-lactamase class C family)
MRREMAQGENPMVKRPLTGIVSIGFGLMLGGPIAAQDVDPADMGAIVQSLEREIHEILEETGIPAISIALVRDGDIAWAGAYGFANVGARVPASTGTYFSTGSTFKFVTATAIMQLVEKGELSLDMTLNRFVGSNLAVEGADEVTFRHMLSHHSGLDGPIGTVPLWSRLAPRTPLELLETTTRVGPAGQDYQYCNVCYGILAWVIEKASGQTYDEYVAQNILQPLGIEIETPSIPAPATVEHLALPYRLEDDKVVPLQQVRYDVFSAGDIYLTAEDMARFLAAQLNGGVFRGQRILAEASIREMHRRQFGGERYGLGTLVTEYEGRVFLQHGGAIPGFNATFVGEPKTRTGVFVMSNLHSSLEAIGPLAKLAMELLGVAPSSNTATPARAAMGGPRPNRPDEVGFGRRLWL